MKAMPLLNTMNNLVEEIISSYESKIRSVGSLFDTTDQLIEGCQETFLDAKQDQQKIKAQVREVLARNEHLRKKDFDLMMQEILSAQEGREKEVKDLLKGYLNRQKEMANELRSSLAQFRTSLAEGEAQRSGECLAFIRRTLADQEMRRESVIATLKGFREEQQEIAKRLRELLNKGRELRIRDLQSMLRGFEDLSDERRARRDERKNDARSSVAGLRRRNEKQSEPEKQADISGP